MTDTANETWSVAGRTFNSRLIVGTGKYADYAQNAAAAEAAGAEIVTVAVRRVNLSDPTQPMLVDYVKPDRFTFLPNTAGCFTGEDAVRTLRLAREAGGWSLVKLEVLSNTAHLYPDMIETLRALDLLIKDGFDVMVYCTDDVVIAKRLDHVDGIQAARATLPYCWFDEDRCREGLNALRNYHYEWDDQKRRFGSMPVHDWASHGASAFRTLSLSWRAPKPGQGPAPTLTDQLLARPSFGLLKKAHFARMRLRAQA